MAIPLSDYVPPEFDLYEFDDEPPSPGTPARRWFSHWNGPVGAPAQEVRLGWSAGDATVLVGTQGQLQHEPWARLGAAHLALGGDELPLPGRLASATATQRELQRIMSSDELWSQAPAMVAGGPASQAAVLAGYAVAWCRVGEGAAFVAAVSISPDKFRLRKVRDWTAYDHDATRRFPLSDLKRSGV
ncbi:MAG: hypothetical protein ACRDOK_29880 [Streptosporangiaceae bacterium]